MKISLKKLISVVFHSYRAAAKNYNDVVIIPSVKQYASLLDLLNTQGAQTTLAQRHAFAAEAFHVSSHYDTMIHQYFMDQNSAYLKISKERRSPLRYGENPHQKGVSLETSTHYLPNYTAKSYLTTTY